MTHVLRVTTIAALAAITACAPRAIAPASTPAMNPVGATVSITPAGPPTTAADSAAETAAERGLRIADRYRVAAITHRRFTHRELWSAMAPALASTALRSEEIGRSINGREIRAVTFGRGPTTVLLWSQMHGDESTASMSLADIFAYLASPEPDALRDRLQRELTVTFVPMLNPDGAELFQRHNAAGIDVNRDGRQQSTPEARALKALRDRIQPQFGFNLHDQNARTRVGPNGLQAGIALLAPAHDDSRSYNETRSRARLVAATIAGILQREIPRRVAKYDESFNPRAFGDLMQAWGTSTVLIESGALPGDPEKQRLRALNVAAILGALDAIATRSYTMTDPSLYESLPRNSGGASDLIVVGGSLVLPGHPAMLADIAINYDEPVAKMSPRVREVGDLREVAALDTLDATGLFLHPVGNALTRRGGSIWLEIGAPATIEVRRGESRSSELVRRLGDR